MRHLFVLFSLLVLLLSGCVHEYLPPARPLAYLFPTVVPGEVLKDLSPCPVTKTTLSEVMQSLSLVEELHRAGLTDAELSLLVRGLNRRGYAELDCRRTAGDLRWIAFAAVDSHLLTITIQRQNGRMTHDIPLK